MLYNSERTMLADNEGALWAMVIEIRNRIGDFTYNPVRCCLRLTVLMLL